MVSWRGDSKQIALNYTRSMSTRWRGVGGEEDKLKVVMARWTKSAYYLPSKHVPNSQPPTP